MATAIVLRTAAGIDELEVLKIGTSDECRAFLFDEIIPSSFTRNVQRLESNDGYLYSAEKLKEGNWYEYKYLLLFGPLQN